MYSELVRRIAPNRATDIVVVGNSFIKPVQGSAIPGASNARIAVLLRHMEMYLGPGRIFLQDEFRSTCLCYYKRIRHYQMTRVVSARR